MGILKFSTILLTSFLIISPPPTKSLMLSTSSTSFSRIISSFVSIDDKSSLTF